MKRSASSQVRYQGVWTWASGACISNEHSGMAKTHCTILLGGFVIQIMIKVILMASGYGCHSSHD